MRAQRGGLHPLTVEALSDVRERRGKAIVVLLCGGDKRTQGADIRHAQAMWKDWKRRQR